MCGQGNIAISLQCNAHVAREMAADVNRWKARRRKHQKTRERRWAGDRANCSRSECATSSFVTTFDFECCNLEQSNAIPSVFSPLPPCAPTYRLQCKHSTASLSNQRYRHTHDQFPKPSSLYHKPPAPSLPHPLQQQQQNASQKSANTSGTKKFPPAASNSSMQRQARCNRQRPSATSSAASTAKPIASSA